MREARKEMRTVGKRERKRLKVVVLIGVVLLLAILGRVAVSMAYKNGVDAGKSEQKEATTSDLRQLGGAIEEKTQTLTKLTDLNAEVSSEINADGIKEYQEKLEKIVGETVNSDAKTALSEYAETWKKFGETYASEDNSAIATALEELRSKASDTAIKITEAYNKVIKETAEKLPE